MFTIDLLKGAGRPPRSRPLHVAGATLVFVALAAVALFQVTQVINYRTQMDTAQRMLTTHEGKIAQLADVAKMLETEQKRRDDIAEMLSEVSNVLGQHSKWSPIITAMAQSVPATVTVTDLMAKREPKKRGQIKPEFDYSLMIGAISSEGPSAVGQFIQALRGLLPLEPDPASVRIVSQRRTNVRGTDVQYYVVECKLKPEKG